MNIHLSHFFLLIARFKIKYHPEESVKRKEEQVSALKVITSKCITYFLILSLINICCPADRNLKFYTLETRGNFSGDAKVRRHRKGVC